MGSLKILAIETSCDECAAAVVERSSKYVKLKSNAVFSQIDLHKRFGGIVPEVASRNHLDMLSIVVTEALEKAETDFKDLRGIAVTNRPGLIGALLVGVSSAKTFAYSLGLPLVLVDHLEGHLHSLFIDGQAGLENLDKRSLPLLVCLVSGGHTNLYLIRSLPPESLSSELISQSRDDAAGEAFDKCAKLLGLPYPGGVLIDELSKKGNAKAFSFPRPLHTKKGRNLEFSFSGIKTAVANQLTADGFKPHLWGDVDVKTTPQGEKLWDYCASIQEAIVETLVGKIEVAIRETKAKGLAIVGGVSANSRLRDLLNQKIKIPVFFPNKEFCTDNAAMIGACGLFMLERGEACTASELLKANAYSNSLNGGT